MQTIRPAFIFSASLSLCWRYVGDKCAQGEQPHGKRKKLEMDSNYLEDIYAWTFVFIPVLNFIRKAFFF